MINPPSQKEELEYSRILRGRIEEQEAQINELKAQVDALTADFVKQLDELSQANYKYRFENNELKVQVKTLKEAINTALRITVFDQIGNRDDDGLIPYGKTETAISVLVDALCSLSESQAAKEK